MSAIKTFAAAIGATVILCAVSSTAFAQKTRADVMQELVQTRHEGRTSMGKNQYPPTRQQIERARARHAATTHGGDVSHAVDQHDTVAAR